MSKYYHRRWRQNVGLDIQCLPEFTNSNILYRRMHTRDRKVLKTLGIFLFFIVLYVNYKIWTLDGPWDTGCALVSRKRFELDKTDYYHPRQICEENTRFGKAAVPNIVHFVLTNTKPVEFPFMYYVSIMSAHNVIQPKEIMFHYVTLPTGEWFDKVKPLLTLVQVEDVTTIFGNPVEVPAHKSDILRMSALLKYGGIYLDLDIIAVRPFTPLLDFSFVMGYMASLPGYFNKFDNLLHQKRFHINGINNAVIISEAQSEFLTRWYSTYHTFDDSDWSYHSVEVPSLLADKYPDDILVMAPSAFYDPTAEKFKDFFSKRGYDFSGNFAIHLWHHLIGKEYVDVIKSNEDVMRLDSSFGALLRYVLHLNTTAELNLN